VASQIRIISSMATRQVLADLLADYMPVTPPPPVSVESVGGVDAAKRVRAGEAFDVVVLAAETITQLAEAGHLVAASRVDLVHSGVAVAVRAGAPRPPIGTEAEVRDAVAAARSIGYSTGPSGTYLARLFERWGIADAIAARIVQAPPGVPVGSLVEQGKAELGFQQLSELMHAPGIEVLGPLPPEIQIVTTFSAARTVVSTQPEAVNALLAFLVSPATAPAKRRHGMEPAD
jgi:molybdate transport system substrate-binding protein